MSGTQAKIKVIPIGAFLKPVAAILEPAHEIAGLVMTKMGVPPVGAFLPRLMNEGVVSGIDTQGGRRKRGQRYPAREQRDAGHDGYGGGEQPTLIIHMYEDTLNLSLNPSGFNSSVKG